MRPWEGSTLRRFLVTGEKSFRGGGLGVVFLCRLTFFPMEKTPYPTSRGSMMYQGGDKIKSEHPRRGVHLYGQLTEWLGGGLQILIRRFESFTVLNRGYKFLKGNYGRKKKT